MGKVKVLKPGGRFIDVSRIAAGTNVKAVLLHKGGSTERVGTMTEEVDLVEAMGVPAIRRATTLDSVRLGKQRTLSIVEADGLWPLAYEAHLPTLDVSARYQDGRVTGIRKQGNRTQIGSGLEIPGDVFDLGSIEIIIRSIAFSDGWSGKFNVADPVGARVTRGRLEVAGSDTVEGLDCWIVASTIDSARVDYKVAKDGSSIVRQSFSPGKGVMIEFA